MASIASSIASSIARLPDNVLWKIFEFKPASEYNAGCAVYVEEISLRKDMPGDTRVLKISVLFKFSPNIDTQWVQRFQTRPFQTRFSGIGQFYYKGIKTKQLKFERIIPKNEDRHTKTEVTLSYYGRFRKTMQDEDIFLELKQVLPTLLSSLCELWFVESEYVLRAPLDLEYWQEQMKNIKYIDDLKRYRLFSYFKLKQTGTMAISKMFKTQKLKY